MSYEYYKALDVEVDASEKDIKRAYYRLVRQHPPEKEPEAFQKIREAYDTLSDPTAKQHYDSMQEGGGENQRLLSQAEEKISAGEWGEAIKILKHLLVLSPGNDVVSNRLGLCFIHQEDYDSAIKLYRSLSESNPDVLSYWIHFGQAFRLKADDLKDKERQENLYKSARNCFEKAIELDLFNSEPFILIARTFMAEQKNDDAVKWLTKAVGADGKLDIQDFDALFLICQIYVMQHEFAKVEDTVKRIQEALQDDQEAFLYASIQFARFCAEVLQIAKQQNLDPDLLRMALSFAEASYRFDPSDNQVLEFASGIFTALQIHKELSKITEDNRLVRGVQSLGFLLAYSLINDENSESQKKLLIHQAIGSLDHEPPEKVLDSLDLLKCEYPEIFDINPSLLREIESIVQSNFQRRVGWRWSSKRTTSKSRMKYESPVHREQREAKLRESKLQELKSQNDFREIASKAKVSEEPKEVVVPQKVTVTHDSRYDLKQETPKKDYFEKTPSESKESDFKLGCFPAWFAGIIIFALLAYLWGQEASYTERDDAEVSDPNVILLESESLSPSDKESADGRKIDVYSIDLDSNQSILIEANSNDFDTFLLFAEPDGDIIAKNDDGEDTSNSQISYVAPVSGTYLIGVSSLQPSRYGQYQIRVTDAEVSDTNVILLESESLSSSDEESADGRKVDVYSIDLDSNQSILIEANSNDFDTFLLFAEPDGHIIAKNDDGEDTSNSQISYVAPVSGTYLIGVSSLQPSRYGQYQIRVTNK